MRPFRWTLAILFACAASAAQGSPIHPETGLPDGLLQNPANKPQGASEARPGDRGPERTRVKWWEDPTWRAELGLSDRQSGKIKEIFEVEIVKLRAMREELNKLEATLAQLVKDDRTNLATLTEQWDRAGNLLSEMYKTRQLMIYRMDRVLTADQRVKLQAMFEKLQAARRPSEPNRRH